MFTSKFCMAVALDIKTSIN